MLGGELYLLRNILNAHALIRLITIKVRSYTTSSVENEASSNGMKVDYYISGYNKFFKCSEWTNSKA